jgi:hypothetical protein
VDTILGRADHALDAAREQGPGHWALAPIPT